MYGEIAFSVGNIEGKFQKSAKFHKEHVPRCFRNSSPELSVPKVQITEVFVKKVNEDCVRPNMNTAEDLRSPAERERMSCTLPLNQKLSLLTCVAMGPMEVRSFNLIGLCLQSHEGKTSPFAY